jgi:MFS family permease
MRFIRGLLALGASSLFILLLIEVNRYIHNPSDYFNIELNVQFFAVWVMSDVVPILCWLFVLLPLLAFSRVLDRWPVRRSGLLGFVTGAMVTTVILLVAPSLIEGTKWKVITILSLLCGIAVAIQFIVVSLTKRWGKAAAPTVAQTKMSGQS